MQEGSRICNRLRGRYSNGNVPCILIDLLAATFLALHFGYLRYNDTGKLHEDGRGDIRHNTQRKNGSAIERATGEGIDKAQDTAARAFVAGKAVGIDAGHRNISTDAVHQYERNGVQNAPPELIDAPDVF